MQVKASTNEFVGDTSMQFITSYSGEKNKQTDKQIQPPPDARHTDRKANMNEMIGICDDGKVKGDVRSSIGGM